MTLQIECRRCGWGIVGGLLPEVRLGWLRIIYADADFAGALQRLRDVLSESTRALKDCLRALADEKERNIRLTKHVAQLELALSDPEHIAALAQESLDV